MEGLKAFTLPLLAVALVGCGSREVMSDDVKVADPYAAMSPQQKIDAIRNDPKITSMQKSSMISDAQKAAGLPVTGQ